MIHQHVVSNSTQLKGGPTLSIWNAQQDSVAPQQCGCSSRMFGWLVGPRGKSQISLRSSLSLSPNKPHQIKQWRKKLTPSRKLPQSHPILALQVRNRRIQSPRRQVDLAPHALIVRERHFIRLDRPHARIITVLRRRQRNITHAMLPLYRPRPRRGASRRCCEFVAAPSASAADGARVDELLRPAVCAGVTGDDGVLGAAVAGDGTAEGGRGMAAEADGGVVAGDVVAGFLVACALLEEHYVVGVCHVRGQKDEHEEDGCDRILHGGKMGMKVSG